jgi:hypothetical protein
VAVETFGVTYSTLSERYFPNGITTSDSQTAATQAIATVAAEVETLLRSHNVNPDEVIEAHAPMSYRWLQNTIMIGAAAEFGLTNAGDATEVVAFRREDFRQAMGRLRNKPHEALVDLAQRRAGTESVYAPR